ncbi:PREDICTED: uncharacterized protein LOC108382993 [Rhagoletis zephyria]|uniref:uncharacterized protein LOC108382993 n=1 Tax=Rhagoletis zephyria TaxID=28612 RepID=UPI0008112737|nr:PREDICTED: uncharacterized protein LOC108382993 [Rhagoletis zephyria]
MGARKKVKLSSHFNFASHQVLNSQLDQSAPLTDCSPPVSNPNKDVMEMLHHIFSKQCDLEARMDKIEENMIQKPDMLAHHKAVRETKVLTKKVHQIICKISGETGEDLHNELNDILPMMSIDAVFDMEG